jgi:polysaccharide export outer membrane protein
MHTHFARRAIFTVLLPLMLLVIARSASAQTESSPADYVIGPTDVLLIQIFDQPDLGGRFSVDADGTLSFPLIGRVKAAGLSVRAFEADLRKRLVPDYFRNPQISVAIETYRSQQAFIRGEVRNPGPVTLTGGMTLIEALSRAGDVMPTASGDVLIVRPTQRQDDEPEFIRASLADIEGGKLKQNIELRSGDQVYVSKAESIYIVGEVKQPGSFSIAKGTTVLQALALAGGPSETAATNRIEIQRTVKGERKKFKVALTDIVLPGDTIVVPQRYF